MGIIKKFRIKNFKKNKALVSLDKISLSFGERRILEDVSFNINEGEILGMLGPNGAGKSTIFNIITGQLKPNAGSVLFNNVNATNYPIYLRTKKFKIGFVPQHGGYFHDLTLVQNLHAIAEILIKNENRRNFKINDLIAKFELDPVRDVKAKLLSGGQKKNW